ncbi:MAG: MBL fold metallo-hydrolase [Anaerolineae bacterium]
MTELVWYGLGCFRLAERGYPTVVTDPFEDGETGLRGPRAAAEIVTCSRLIDDPIDVEWPGLRDVRYTVAGPGEYEIGGVFITGVASPRSRKRGETVEQNVIYTISYRGVAICHLGELGRPPTQKQVERIGRVNVLLVPVGIPGGLTPAMVSETISMIEPDVVVPMQYKTPGLKVERRPVHGFLKEMGVSHPETVSSLQATSRGEPEDLQILLLEPQER